MKTMAKFTQLTAVIGLTSLGILTGAIPATAQNSEELLEVYIHTDDALVQVDAYIESEIATALIEPGRPKFEVAFLEIDKRTGSKTANQLRPIAVDPYEMSLVYGIPLIQDDLEFTEAEAMVIGEDDLIFHESEGTTAVPDDMIFKESDALKPEDDHTVEIPQDEGLTVSAGNLYDGVWASELISTSVTGCPAAISPVVEAAAMQTYSKRVEFSQPNWHPTDFGSGFALGTWDTIGQGSFKGVMAEQGGAGAPIQILVTMTMGQVTTEQVDVGSIITIKADKNFAALLGNTDNCQADVKANYVRIAD